MTRARNGRCRERRVSPGGVFATDRRVPRPLPVALVLAVVCCPARVAADVTFEFGSPSGSVAAAVVPDAETGTEYRVRNLEYDTGRGFVRIDALTVGGRVYEDLDCDGFRALAGVNRDIDGFVATLARSREAAEAQAEELLEQSDPFTAILGGLLLGLEVAVFPDIAAICGIDIAR